MILQKKFILIIALIIPFSFATPVRAITDDQVIICALAAIASIPASIAGYLMYKKVRICNRNNEQVCQEAEIFIKKTDFTYRDFNSLLEKVKPESKYGEAKAAIESILKKASKMASGPWPLLYFKNQLQLQIDVLKQHRNWLIERESRMDSLYDISCIDKTKQLIDRSSKLISNLEELHTIIIEYFALAY